MTEMATSSRTWDWETTFSQSGDGVAPDNSEAKPAFGALQVSLPGRPNENQEEEKTRGPFLKPHATISVNHLRLVYSGIFSVHLAKLSNSGSLITDTVDLWRCRLRQPVTTLIIFHTNFQNDNIQSWITVPQAPLASRAAREAPLPA